MDQIQPYLDYFAGHPDWALIIIFLIAFGEALLVIGLLCLPLQFWSAQALW